MSSYEDLEDEQDEHEMVDMGGEEEEEDDQDAQQPDAPDGTDAEHPQEDEPEATEPFRAPDGFSTPTLAEAVPTEGGEPATKRQRREDSALLQPDAILKWNVFDEIATRVTEGCTGNDILDELEESYVGNGDACNLLLDCFSVLGHHSTELQRTYLKECLLHHFTTEAADTTLNDTGPPEWLNELLSGAEWQDLFFKLGESHSDSHLVTYAMENLMDNKKHCDVASSSPDLAQNFFKVFVEGLKQHAALLMQLGPDELTFSANWTLFVELCAKTQYTYITAQVVLFLLAHVAEQQQRPFFKRLFEELELELIAQEEGSSERPRIDTCRTNWLYYVSSFHQASGVLETTQVDEVRRALQPMLLSKSTNVGDILKLHKLYATDEPPSASYLQHKSFLDLMVRDLVPNQGNNEHRGVPPAHRSKYVWLLAHACGTTTKFVVASEETNFEDLMEGTSAVVTATGDSTTDRLVDESSQVPAVRESLDTLLRILNATQNETGLLKEIQAHLKWAGCAMCTLQWVDHAMHNMQQHLGVPTTLHRVVPNLLRILHHIAKRHSAQHATIFNIVEKYFHPLDPTSIEPDQTVAYKKMLLQLLLQLVHQGFAVPVLSKFAIWSKELDSSLIRMFVCKLFRMTKAPYSHSYTKLAVKLLQLEKVIDAWKTPSSLADSPVFDIMRFLDVVKKYPIKDKEFQVQLARVKEQFDDDKVPHKAAAASSVGVA